MGTKHYICVFSTCFNRINRWANVKRKYRVEREGHKGNIGKEALHALLQVETLGWISGQVYPAKEA